MKDFYMLPRQIRRDLVDGLISPNEMLLLVWIFFTANPTDGRCEVSYQDLVITFHNQISYQSMRKIISNLRKKQKIWFFDHKGKAGKFTIYPLTFKLTDGHVQILDDFGTPELDTKNKTWDDIVQARHNSEEQNHNYDDDVLPGILAKINNSQS